MKCQWLILFCIGFLGCKKTTKETLHIVNTIQLEPFVIDTAIYPQDKNDKHPCSNPINYAPYYEVIADQKIKEINCFSISQFSH